MFFDPLMGPKLLGAFEDNDDLRRMNILVFYSKEIQSFLKRGGMLGWGIVPVVSDHLKGENTESLIQRLEEGIKRLVQQGIDEKTLAESSWVLPSCETVLLTPEESDRALKITSEISRAMKKKYGFDQP